MSGMDGFTTLIRFGLLSTALVFALLPQPTRAQTMDHTKMKMPMPAQPPTPPAQSAADDHAAAASEPRTPIPPLSDADRAAAFAELARPMEHASPVNRYVLLDRLETWDAGRATGQAWDGLAWVGSDLHRLWLRSEGERVGGRTEAADLEALYGRSVSPWWDLLVGVKHDFQPGNAQDWVAIGVQGLAPYKFEVQATAYVGESGRSLARVEAEYELLLSGRLILQPRVEINAYGKDDPQRGIGSGLSTSELGLRLRWEWRREFAPYLGVVYERAYGNTADLRRLTGDATHDTRLVAGIRIWF